MPLLTSPIDGSAMRRIRRYGIELDVCPTSGGVWLDKGELEKLITLVSDEASESEADRSRDAGHRDEDEDDFEDDHDEDPGVEAIGQVLVQAARSTTPSPIVGCLS
mgnify:CR=1 FL=1